MKTIVLPKKAFGAELARDGGVSGGDAVMLSILVTTCVAAFVGLVILGHVILLMDFWHFRRTPKAAEPTVTHAHVPAE
jgi:hypothetical protein